jgi:hypothetical protein
MKSLIIPVCLLLVSCDNQSLPDLEKEKKEILQLEAKQREYHFTKNAKAFVALFSDEFLSINRGKIDQPTREKSYDRFDTYFKSVDFIKWDDNKEPIVRFSKDGSIAYVAIDKTVITKAMDKNGKEIFDTTNFAWLTIYKKENNGWKIDCVTSTDK